MHSLCRFVCVCYRVRAPQKDMTVIYFRRLGENTSPRCAEYLRQSQDAMEPAMCFTLLTQIPPLTLNICDK